MIGFHENKIVAQNKEDGKKIKKAEIAKLEKRQKNVAEKETCDRSKEEIKKNIDKKEHAEQVENADQKQEIKVYNSGEEKLLAEEDEMIASVKPEFKKVMQAQMDLIFKELICWTKQDSEFEKKVLLCHKSMKRCMKFCAEKARNLREPSDQEKTAARDNNIPIMTPVGSDMLFEWIKEYYDKDDKEEFEKEKKVSVTEKKASIKKKSIEKKSTEKKKMIVKEHSLKRQEKELIEKKKDTRTFLKKQKKSSNSQIDGQVSIFDFI